MKLGYLSSAEVPSEAANALHVVKMCQALGDQGVDVVLYALDGQRELSDIQDFYGFAPNFLVQTFRHTKIPGGGYRLALKVWWREMHRPRCDFYYGRHLHTLLALTSLGVPCAFEAHAMPKNRYVQFLWRRLAKSKHCQAIVC